MKLVARLAPLGLLTGLAAGFFGIGGGFLIVPGLMLATGMTMANATASSLLSVALFGAATSSTTPSPDRSTGASPACSCWAAPPAASLACSPPSGSPPTPASPASLFALLIFVVAAYVAWRSMGG